MAYTQVDPARLRGEALTRWYLRSPADIEQERQDTAAQRHNDFFAATPPAGSVQGFGRGGPGGTNGGPHSDITWVATGPNRWSSQPRSSDRSQFDPFWGQDGNTDALRAGDRGYTQLAANVWDCAGCHAGPTRPPPPSTSTPPKKPPPPYSAPWTPTSPPRKPAKPPPRQCAMQNMNDSRICSREPGVAWKSVCLQSAAEREAHCIASDGEIGWPPLNTHDRW